MRDNAEVIAPPRLIYLAPLLVGLRLHRVLPVAFRPRRLARILGWALLGSATVVEIWFVLTMARARTPINPTRPVARVVTSGPFRWSRNPSYLTFTMIYTGIASLVNTLWPMLLLPMTLLIIQRAVIEREERYLEQKFGEEYLRYKGRVRRWV